MVLDPIDKDEHPQLGKKEVRKGISSFFLHPGKIDLGEYDDSYKCFTKEKALILWLIYIAGNGLGFGFQTQWLRCTVHKLFTLHRLGLGSLLPIIGQESESVPESVSGNVNEPLKFSCPESRL